MPISELSQIGSAFGARGLEMQRQQQQQQFETKQYIGQQALKMIDERAAAGDVQFLNDPDLQKHLKPFIGPQTMEALLPFKQKEAEYHANQNQMKANIAKFAAQLGQRQQQGGTLAPNAIPTLVSAGESAGMKPADLESAGLQIKQPKVNVPGELNALAAARGYKSFADAPTKVKGEINAQSQQQKVETAGATAGAKTAAVDAQKKADESSSAAPQPGPAQPPPAPGTLPPVMDFNQWQQANPSVSDPKMAKAAFLKDQGAYKKELTQIRGIESAKTAASKIGDNIVKYMDDNGLTGGGLADTAKAKAFGEFPNVSPPKYQKLYTLLSQLRAAAMPAYLAKGGPRSKAYLDQMTKHLPSPTDNPAFIREQISAFGPFVDQLQEQNRRSIADDFGIQYTPAPTIEEKLNAYKVP